MERGPGGGVAHLLGWETFPNLELQPQNSGTGASRGVGGFGPVESIIKPFPLWPHLTKVVLLLKV